MSDKVKKNCQERSNFFVQYSCVYPSTQQVGREIKGLTLATMAVFVYFFTIIYLDYIRVVEKNKFVDFDV